MCYTCIHCGHCEKSFDELPDDTPGLCVACKFQNDSESSVCENCGAPLLKAPAGPAASSKKTA